MKRLQLLLLALCAWFFFFYNIERLSAPINLASFVYVFLFLSAGTVILIPPFVHWPLWRLLVLGLPLYFILKRYLGYEIMGRGLPLTVTEITAIIVTVLITRTIMQRLTGLQRSVEHLTFSHLKQEIPFNVGQGLIYREIRRARSHKRPLTLLAIAPTKDSVNFSLDRYFKEAQKEIVRRYVDARVADLLLAELDDYNIVTQRNGHFIALLTEAELEEVAQITKRLEKAATEKLGLRFKIGHSVFPNEAVTFEQLLLEAEARMAESLAEPVDAAGEEAEEKAEELEGTENETQRILPTLEEAHG